MVLVARHYRYRLDEIYDEDHGLRPSDIQRLAQDVFEERYARQAQELENALVLGPMLIGAFGVAFSGSIAMYEKATKQVWETIRRLRGELPPPTPGHSAFVQELAGAAHPRSRSAEDIAEWVMANHPMFTKNEAWVAQQEGLGYAVTG